jgi:hypothetical protein
MCVVTNDFSTHQFEHTLRTVVFIFIWNRTGSPHTLPIYIHFVARPVVKFKKGFSIEWEAECTNKLPIETVHFSLPSPCPRIVVCEKIEPADYPVDLEFEVDVERLHVLHPYYDSMN